MDFFQAQVLVLFSVLVKQGASTTSTQTGSELTVDRGTRYDCTVSHSGTYRTVRWYLGLLHGAQLGVTEAEKHNLKRIPMQIVMEVCYTCLVFLILT